MSRYINNDSIEELRSQINIVDEIAKVVELKRAGANYKGCCPFHNEKTPSFVVSEQKQIFTCFGCGESGNVFKFVQRYYNLDFVESVEKLAKENGVTLKLEGHEDGKRERFYDINRLAARFFYKAFTEGANAGYTYMKKRGIEDAVLKKFGIGYADGEWNSLHDHLKVNGVDEKEMLELGLISEKNGKYYDKFRDRVMFPIINTSGKVIGFGGRAIGDANPKYLNSPENRVFSKKNNLYALNTCKQDIGKDNCAIIVEGYMDVISLYQGGVHNAIASLGTALTENQAKLIKRYTKNIVLSYDADQAGRKAALRGIDVLGTQGLKVKVLHVTDGKDPDEFMKAHGKQAFLELVDGAMPAIEYKFDSIRQNVDINNEEGKIDFLRQAAALLRTLSPVEADVYIKKLSAESGISEGAIRMEVTTGAQGAGSGYEQPSRMLGPSYPPDSGYMPQQHYPDQAYRQDYQGRDERFDNNRVTSNRFREEIPPEDRIEDITNLELTLIKALIINPPFIEELVGKDIMQSPPAKKIFNIMLELYGLKEDFDQAEIMDRLAPEQALKLTAMLERVLIAGNEDKVFSECLTSWELERLTEKEKEIITKLSLADEDAGEGVINGLTEELMQVQKKIKMYGGKI